ncbi:phosphotransferase [Actinocorallia longicatena]|uniref:Phosphotransferase family enzyme n=1 Tax=Actinocorallia longicatena TaxID=111803 RepID=A0ABP6Q5L8_9ACTN
MATPRGRASFTEQEAGPLLDQAAARLGARVRPGVHPIIGVGGRTLATPVTHGPGEDQAWLRLLASTEPDGKLWNGLADAEHLPDLVFRPRLLASTILEEGADRAVRADLLTYITAPALSSTPDLPTSRALPLGTGWWDDLRCALGALSKAAPVNGREPVISATYIRRTVPAFVGVDVDPMAGAWEMAHGDLHWANLTGAPLSILDWEGHGLAPAGFDAAYLLAHSLPVPDIAQQVRSCLADALSGQAGRLARLTVAAIILQAAERTDIHARLAPLVRADVADLLT